VSGLLRPAEALARVPIGEPEQTLSRFVPMIQNGFPQFELRISGHEDLRYPPESRLDPPPAGVAARQRPGAQEGRE